MRFESFPTGGAAPTAVPPGCVGPVVGSAVGANGHQQDGAHLTSGGTGNKGMGGNDPGFGRAAPPKSPLRVPLAPFGGRSRPCRWRSVSSIHF